jgi:hypothetical protein
LKSLGLFMKILVLLIIELFEIAVNWLINGNISPYENWVEPETKRGARFLTVRT